MNGGRRAANLSRAARFLSASRPRTFPLANMTRKLHLLVFAAALLAFLGTGQYMDYHAPAMPDLPPDQRVALRSRHIYILMTGLINLAAALAPPVSSGWRLRASLLGSALLCFAPVAMFLSFAGADAGPLESPILLPGVIAALAGTVLLAIARWGASTP